MDAATNYEPVEFHDVSVQTSLKQFASHCTSTDDVMQETPSESTVKGKAQDVPSHFSYEILLEDNGIRHNFIQDCHLGKYFYMFLNF